MKAERLKTAGLVGGDRALAMALKAGAASVLLLALGMSGCHGPGAFTTERLTAAKEAENTRKAATEWDQARQAFLSGDLDKAMKQVERSIAIRSSVPKSWVLRGRILMELSNLDDAAASLDKAVALDPNFAEAHYYLGIVMERISNSQRAMECYTKAAELEPSNPQYVIAAAEMQIDMGKFDEAEAYLTSRTASFEHNAGVRQTLGHLAMIRGDALKGASLFNEARLLAPDDNAVLEDLVRAQIATSQFAEAEFNLSRLTQGDEGEKRRDLRHLRLRCLVEVDRVMEAREIAIKLTQGPAGQADVQAWIELGNISFMLNDLSRTRQAASRVMSIAPERTEGYVINALQLRRAGNYKEALSYLEKATAIRAESQTYLLMGIVYQDLRRPADARRSFQQAAKIDPKDQTVVRMLAQTSEKAPASDD